MRSNTNKSVTIKLLAIENSSLQLLDVVEIAATWYPYLNWMDDLRRHIEDNWFISKTQKGLSISTELSPIEILDFIWIMISWKTKIRLLWVLAVIGWWNFFRNMILVLLLAMRVFRRHIKGFLDMFIGRVWKRTSRIWWQVIRSVNKISAKHYYFSLFLFLQRYGLTFQWTLLWIFLLAKEKQ